MNNVLIMENKQQKTKDYCSLTLTKHDFRIRVPVSNSSNLK